MRKILMWGLFIFAVIVTLLATGGYAATAIQFTYQDANGDSASYLVTSAATGDSVIGGAMVESTFGQVSLWTATPTLSAGRYNVSGYIMVGATKAGATAYQLIVEPSTFDVSTDDVTLVAGQFTKIGDTSAVKVWNRAFGSAFTAGSMGDSLNNASYVQGSASGLTVADIADAVWDEDTTGHNTAASYSVMLKDTSAYQGAASGLSVADIADGVWDEINTGGAHNDAGSTGRQLRELADVGIIRANTAQAGGSNTITLDAGASAVDGMYDPSKIYITGGTGVGQTRNILQYDGAGRVAWVDRNWKVIPDATSEFSILPNSGREHVNEGRAQGGTASTIILNLLASSDDNAYVGQNVFIRSGPGEDQVRNIISYNGTTKVADIDTRNWDVTPTDSSVYVMLPTGYFEPAIHAGQTADSVFYKDSTDMNTGGSTTFGALMADPSYVTGAGLSGNGAYTITVVVVDTGAAVDSVLTGVTVYANNTAQNTTPWQASTLNTGAATFQLDAGTYVRFITTAGFAPKLDTFTVSAISTDNLFVYKNIGARTNLSWIIQSPASGKYAGARAYFDLKSVNDSMLVLSDSTITTNLSTSDISIADANGQFSINLWPNSLFTNDSSYYTVTVRSAKGKRLINQVKFRMPDSAGFTVNMKDLIRWK